MELSEIRASCRSFLDDEVEEYLISDADLNQRINEAQKEACIRSDLLIDSANEKICELTVTAGINNYAISPLITDVLRAELPSASQLLLKLGYKALDEDNRNWMIREGTPYAYALDVQKNHLFLSHLPKVDETLTLTVSRLPSEDMEGDSDEPEINEKYHYGLVFWALHLCYLEQDADMYDLRQAERYEQKFQLLFGDRPTVKEQEFRLRSYRRRSRAHFF